MPPTEDRSLEAVREIGRINAFYPILPLLGNRWAATRPWEGLTLGLNLHLTTLTACLVRELALGGGTFVLSAANPATTDAGTVDHLRGQGFDVYTGADMEDRHQQVLEHAPDLFVDVGFGLVDTLLSRRADLVAGVRGAVEITRSGITALRKGTTPPFPVVNINDGRLKDAVENRHGVGEAIWAAVSRLTGMHLAGRRVAVVGYGPVGKGLALYARNAGMSAEVVEHDPVRRLFAHYDGFPTPSLEDALSRVGTVVTATGGRKVITAEHMRKARHGVVVVNAGHGGDEIDIAGIQQAAESVDHVTEHVVRYTLEDGPVLTVLGNGHPLNIVLNSGSPEPVLLHYAVLGLTLEWLVGDGRSAQGEVLVPDAIEEEAARAALLAMDMARGAFGRA
jgi:adenosylhomocysteinase